MRLFPLGTVTILTPGTSANFGFRPDQNFDALAEKYTEIYVDSGHPVFNPSFIYDTMEPNFWKSAVREGEGKKKKQARNEDGSLKFNFERDIHFKDCEENYDIMTTLITHLCSITQVLGNLCDVARAIELPFLITTPEDTYNHLPRDELRPAFFPLSSGRGARSVTGADRFCSSGPKGPALSGNDLGGIPEASVEEILACNLRFPRCPVKGDLMVANCGRSGNGNLLPQPRGYFINDDGSLDHICKYEFNSHFGPVRAVRTNLIEGNGGTLSVEVPLAPGKWGWNQGYDSLLGSFKSRGQHFGDIIGL